jgi:uncharacterized protein YkwD
MDRVSPFGPPSLELAPPFGQSFSKLLHKAAKNFLRDPGTRGLSARLSMLPRMHAPPCARRRSGRARRPRLTLAAVAAVLAFGACCGTFGAPSLAALQTASAAGTPRTSGGARWVGRLHALEPQVFAAINDLRRNQGLAPLRLSRALTIAAGEHSLSMAKHGYFEHSSLDGAPFWKRVAARYAWPGTRWSVGENLVWASPRLSARSAVERWLASPSHRATLLSPAWRDVGLGAVHAVAGGVYGGRVVTILTADFGVRR